MESMVVRVRMRVRVRARVYGQWHRRYSCRSADKSDQRAANKTQVVECSQSRWGLDDSGPLSDQLDTSGCPTQTWATLEMKGVVTPTKTACLDRASDANRLYPGLPEN